MEPEPQYGQHPCGHNWPTPHIPECDKLLFACASCLKVLPIGEGLRGTYRAVYCSVTCQLQHERGEHIHHKALRLGLPILERIAVALERLVKQRDPFGGGQ